MTEKKLNNQVGGGSFNVGGGGSNAKFEERPLGIGGGTKSNKFYMNNGFTGV